MRHAGPGVACCPRARACGERVAQLRRPRLAAGQRRPRMSALVRIPPGEASTGGTGAASCVCCCRRRSRAEMRRKTARGAASDGRRRDHRGRRPGGPSWPVSCAWPECGRWYWSGSRGCERPRRPTVSMGRSVELLRYRGLLDRVEAASGRPVHPAPGAPFGGMHLDFHTWRIRRYGRCPCRNRGSSGCSTNALASSAPAYAADTRWPGSARTTPR